MAAGLSPLLLLPLCLAAGCTPAVEEEWAQRRELKRLVQEQLPVVDDPEVRAYINRIGRDIVAETDMADRRWDFAVVRDYRVNAFNLPGGLVYVNTGLVREADTLDQLVGVLAHEVAHGTERHAARQEARNRRIGILARVFSGRGEGPESIAATLAAGSASLGYSREDEREADRLGLRYARAAGYDPRGALDFFLALHEKEAKEPTALAQILSTHPVTAERVEYLETTLQDMHEGLFPPVSDTDEYQAFRRRLGAAGGTPR